jgi:hypothetical protein
MDGLVAKPVDAQRLLWAVGKHVSRRPVRV